MMNTKSHNCKNVLLNLSLAAWSDNENENVDWGIGKIVFTFRRSRKSHVDNQHSKRRIRPGKHYNISTYFPSIVVCTFKASNRLWYAFRQSGLSWHFMYIEYLNNGPLDNRSIFITDFYYSVIQAMTLITDFKFVIQITVHKRAIHRCYNIP